RRADVAVVAVGWRATDTRAPRARVVRRASVAVAARRVVVHVQAAELGVAEVVGARVPVVAADGRAAEALPVQAEVDAGAGVPVVAVGRRSTHTRAVRTRIGGGADVAIGARRGREPGHGADGARPVAGAVHVAGVPVAAGRAGGRESAVRGAAAPGCAGGWPQVTLLARVEDAVAADLGPPADQGAELVGPNAAHRQ